MNKRQKEVELAKLKAEEQELKHLKAIYNKAADDITEKLRISNGKINVLLKDFDNLDDVQKSILQSQIYQRNFQLSLKKQIDGFLSDLKTDQYKSIDDYLKKSYKTGFIGTMYDLHGQGIPLVIPIDQKQAAAAIKLDPKISKNLYTKLGEDVEFLKKRIANNVSRGIATASEYSVIARNIAADSNVGFNRAMRIARTEGHGVQIQAAVDAQYSAKDAGADVVKQWDATLDGRTRESHRRVDGEIRELDEKFSNGMMYPSDSAGGAEEVINCRCALLQRARWALDEDELQTLKDRAAYFGMDKANNFDDFQQKYMNAAETVSAGVPNPAKAFTPANTIEEAKNYAKDKLGLFRADYDKMPLDFANMINKEVTRVYNTFGNLNAKGRLEAIIIWPKKVSWYAAYSSNSKLVGLKNVTSKGVLKKWAKDAAEQYAAGFWSTNNAEHVIRHELGHAVQHMILDNNAGKLNRIQLLHKRLMRELGIDSWSANKTDPDKLKRAGKHISYYALSNENELVAESVAEYMAGNPRPVAKKVIEILTSDNMDFDLDEIMKEIL